MISLSKTGNAIKFTFTDNGHYLQNGTIEVPVNSLTLVTDDSDMFTFKKSATNDIFVSGLYSEIGMTKAELETYYKDNMVGSTGGGDITSGEVQTMIDESISGKADVSAVTESINEAVSGKVDESAFTAYSGSVDARLTEDERVTAAALNVLNANKLDASAYTPTDLSEYWTSAQTDSAITAAVSGKQDTLIAGDNITISGNVISATGGGGGGTVDQSIISGSTNAVAGGAVFNAVNYVDTTEDWYYVNWDVDDETKVSEEINSSIIRINYETSEVEPNESASVDVTFEGDEQTYTITFYNDEGTEPHWDLNSISDYLVNYFWDGDIELTITANTPFNVVSASTDVHLLMHVYKYSETTTVTSVKNTVSNSLNGAAINGYNNIIELVATFNNGNQTNTSIGLVDLKTTDNGQLATDIKVPIGHGGWIPVTIVDYSTKETEEINENQVKITLTGTPSDGNIIYVEDEDSNWGTITYNSGNWSDDTQLGLTIVLDGNVLYLTASNNQLIKAITADDNPELIDSVQKTTVITQDLIPYVQETKSDLGGLKLQQVTQAEYDALVSGGTIDNSTLYVITNS